MTLFDEGVTAFLQRPLHAVLATLDPATQTISQSVVWFHLDTGGDAPSVWVSCAPKTAKVRHVGVNPEVSLLVLAPHGGAYVRIHGQASIDETVSATDRHALVSLYHGPESDHWISQHPLPEPNVKLRIRPERVVQRGI